MFWTADGFINWGPGFYVFHDIRKSSITHKYQLDMLFYPLIAMTDVFILLGPGAVFVYLTVMINEKDWNNLVEKNNP